MRKYLLILVLFLFVPIYVNAESKYLYDVLKNEAESNGLAKEYTGEHHDSFTEEPTHKIYHWYADNDNKGLQVLEKNNIIFGGFCWQMIRTTDTGGVKIIYNGTPNNGICNNTGEEQQIGKSLFNIHTNALLGEVGYMYNSDISTELTYDYNTSVSKKYGTDVSYSNGKYTLISASSTRDENHHYTCNSTETQCTKVYYITTPITYFSLSNGMKIEDLINESLWAENVNKTNSKVKEMIDEWYETNMLEYANFIEDTIFCNDRIVDNLLWFNPNGGTLQPGVYSYFNSNNSTNLICTKDTDSFSINNNLAKLKFPIALLSVPETKIMNNKNIVKTNAEYLLISPTFITYDGYEGINSINTDGSIKIFYNYNDPIGVRPVISLNPMIEYTNGNGSKETPYIIKTANFYKVIIEAEIKKGDIEFEIADVNSLPEGEEVKFKIVPNKGYILKDLKITDEENNNIDYITNDNINFKFTIPATDVTIKPQYKEIDYNLVNPNTKRQIILIVISIIIIGLITKEYIIKKKRLT